MTHGLFSCHQAAQWMVQSLCLSVCPSVYQLYHWKISCVGRSTVLLEDELYHWKMNCDVGRSVVLLEDQPYWRQSTGIDRNYQSRKITARRWLASPDTYIKYAIQMSVTPFSLCSHRRIIMKFSGVTTNNRSDVHAKGQGQTSKVKVTEVKTQLSHFRTVTPGWIHIWWWDDAQSLMLLRRGALLLFFKVIRQISRSHS